MEKILVTGAGGFIGSHLTELLIRQGYNVRAFVHYNSLGTWGWLDKLPQEVKSDLDVFPGDIRDSHGVTMALRGCSAVFHLAALIAIPFSYHSPDTYVDTNIKGTLNVLQASRDLDVSRVLVTSTSEVYGTAQYTPIDENHPYHGQSPYSATKIGADMLSEAFFRSFSTPVTIVRPFNTFGPRQSARAVIPAIITQLLSGAEVIKLGNLIPSRDFVYVKDTVNAFIEIFKTDATIGQIINIATGREFSIRTVAEEMIRQINPVSHLETSYDRFRPEKSEVLRLVGNNEKIKRLTAWEPRYSFENGITETITFLKENLNLYKTDIYNI